MKTETKTYSKSLLDPRWQKKRLRIMQRDDFACTKCGDKETTLNVHHSKYYSGFQPWEYDDEHLFTLCEHCHFEITELNKVEQTPYNQIEIYKISGKQKNGDIYRFMAVLHKGSCNLRLYNNDKYCINLPFGRRDLLMRLSDMFRKASEWIPSKNRYATGDDVFDLPVRKNNEDSIFNMKQYKSDLPF